MTQYFEQLYLHLDNKLYTLTIYSCTTRSDQNGFRLMGPLTKSMCYVDHSWWGWNTVFCSFERDFTCSTSVLACRNLSQFQFWHVDMNCYGSKQPVLVKKMRISNDVVEELRQWSSYLEAISGIFLIKKKFQNVKLTLPNTFEFFSNLLKFNCHYQRVDSIVTFSPETCMISLKPTSNNLSLSGYLYYPDI